MQYVGVQAGDHVEAAWNGVLQHILPREIHAYCLAGYARPKTPVVIAFQGDAREDAKQKFSLI